MDFIARISNSCEYSTAPRGEEFLSVHVLAFKSVWTDPTTHVPRSTHVTDHHHRIVDCHLSLTRTFENSSASAIMGRCCKPHSSHSNAQKLNPSLVLIHLSHTMLDHEQGAATYETITTSPESDRRNQNQSSRLQNEATGS